MDSYYPSGDDQTSTDAPAQTDTDTGSEPDGGDPNEGNVDEGMEGQTALIPKTLLTGEKYGVGDTVRLKIVHDHGDELEVQCVGGKADETDGGAMRGMADAEDRLSAMAST